MVYCNNELDLVKKTTGFMCSLVFYALLAPVFRIRIRMDLHWF
jgi:hypothetical protein